MEWTAERVAAFWDWHSQFPEQYFAHRHGAALAAQLARHVPPPAHVLDYGSGPGFLLPHLLAAGYQVTACDVSPESLARAVAQAAGHPRFAGALATDDPALAATGFDAVVMTELVEHVDDATLAAILASALRLLRPGGLLFVTTPNEEDLSAQTVFCPASNMTFHRWQHVRAWSGEGLAAALRARGFVEARFGVTDFALARAPVRRLLHRCLRPLRPGRRPPHLWATARREGAVRAA
jgi:SAM-dependent methyltransferase